MFKVTLKITLVFSLIFTFSNCDRSSVGPDSTAKGDGTMATIDIPEGFDFSMYTEIEVLYQNQDFKSKIERISVSNSPVSAPIWSKTVHNQLTDDDFFEVRSAQKFVYVTVGYRNGDQRTFQQELSNNQLIFDFSQLSSISGKTQFGKTTGSCTDSIYHGGGYSTVLDTVIASGGNYEVTITIHHDGCSAGSSSLCQALSHYSIEIPSGINLVNASWSTNSSVSGNLVFGLGNNDGFDGFKLDNVSNLGDGQAGTFSITYLVSDLETSQFLVKNGTNYQYGSFTKVDFECKLDTDDDGVTDNNDDYPVDPDLSYLTITDTASFAVEDTWPWEGDFDFNDLVMPYFLKCSYNADNELVKLVFVYKFLARGASQENGMGFSLITDPSTVSVSGYNHTDSYVSHNGGVEVGSTSELSVVVQDLVIDKLEQFNTIRGVGHVPDNYDSVVVEFNTPVSYLVAHSFNPYLIISKDRSREIHLPNEKPTFKADPDLIGFGLDAGNYTTEVFYVQDDGKPWIINVPGEFKYVYEQEEITQGYLNFVAWAQSGGVDYQDWYDVEIPANVNTEYIYGY